MNLFAYSGANPVNFADYSGLAPDWFSCWSNCIQQNRLDPLAIVSALFTALPKTMVPPFRVVNSRQRLTTLLSVAAHYIGNDSLASLLRSAGRGISRVATPVTIAEGFYDIGVITYCALKCEVCQ